MTSTRAPPFHRLLHPFSSQKKVLPSTKRLHIVCQCSLRSLSNMALQQLWLIRRLRLEFAVGLKWLHKPAIICPAFGRCLDVLVLRMLSSSKGPPTFFSEMDLLGRKQSMHEDFLVIVRLYPWQPVNRFVRRRNNDREAICPYKICR